MTDIIIDAPTLHLRHIEPGECDVMVNLVLGGIFMKDIPQEAFELPQGMKVRIIIQKEGMM